jgi:hypothetical protein
MEANMTRSLILAATVLALSGAAASAQVLYPAPGYGYAAPGYGYVAPGYGYAAPYVAPTYVAPDYGYAAPAYVAPGYAAPPQIYPAPSAPVYDYAPGYVDTYSVTNPGWDW